MSLFVNLSLNNLLNKQEHIGITSRPLTTKNFVPGMALTNYLQCLEIQNRIRHENRKILQVTHGLAMRTKPIIAYFFLFTWMIKSQEGPRIFCMQCCFGCCCRYQMQPTTKSSSQQKSHSYN